MLAELKDYIARRDRDIYESLIALGANSRAGIICLGSSFVEVCDRPDHADGRGVRSERWSQPQNGKAST